MKAAIHRLLASALLAALFISPARAGIVRFTAVIDASQSTTGSDSAALGLAMMAYDVGTNRLDLVVTINGLANTLDNSHIHEGLPGVAGGVSEPLGPEASYTRDGDRITGTFLDVEYSGDPAALLAGGAYLNFHTAAWPGGEVRGQLIPEAVRLAALITPGQETGAVDSDAFGAALGSYDPLTNEISLAIFVYSFANTLSNSHIHEAPAGMDGSVVTGLGGAAAYRVAGQTYTQVFEGLDYGGSAVALLTGGAYLNFHSNAYAGGEVRGQLTCPDGAGGSRLVNVSARGSVGTGDNVLITGFVIVGDEPMAVLATGRGPFLAQFGVANALADPVSTVFASRNGREHELMRNDDLAQGPYGAAVLSLGFGIDIAHAAEAANLLILPPGAYTNVVSGAGGSGGVALAETYLAPWEID